MLTSANKNALSALQRQQGGLKNPNSSRKEDASPFILHGAKHT